MYAVAYHVIRYKYSTIAQWHKLVGLIFVDNTIKLFLLFFKECKVLVCAFIEMVEMEQGFKFLQGK